MEQTLHGILNGRSGEQEPIPTLESKESLPPSTGRVLDVLSLVEDHILPLDSLEVLLILSHLRRERTSVSDSSKENNTR